MNEIAFDFHKIGITPQKEVVFRSEIGSIFVRTESYGTSKTTIKDRHASPTRIVLLSYTEFYLPGSKTRYGEGQKGKNYGFSVDFLDQKLGSIGWGGLTKEIAQEVFQIATEEGPIKAETKRQELMWEK